MRCFGVICGKREKYAAFWSDMRRMGEVCRDFWRYTTIGRGWLEYEGCVVAQEALHKLGA